MSSHRLYRGRMSTKSGGGSSSQANAPSTRMPCPSDASRMQSTPPPPPGPWGSLSEQGKPGGLAVQSPYVLHTPPLDSAWPHAVLEAPVARASRIFVQRPRARPPVSATLWQQLQLSSPGTSDKGVVPSCLCSLNPSLAPPINPPSSFLKYSPCSDSGPKLLIFFF